MSGLGGVNNWDVGQRQFVGSGDNVVVVGRWWGEIWVVTGQDGSNGSGNLLVMETMG